MSMIQAAALGITAVVLAIQIKTLKAEYSLYLILGTMLIVAFMSLSRMELILENVERLCGYLHMEPVYLGTMLKMAGIAYIAEFASGICKDTGYSALGTQIEMFGKLSILAISAPVLAALLETLQGFVS